MEGIKIKVVKVYEKDDEPVVFQIQPIGGIPYLFSKSEMIRRFKDNEIMTLTNFTISNVDKVENPLVSEQHRELFTGEIDVDPDIPREDFINLEFFLCGISDDNAEYYISSRAFESDYGLYISADDLKDAIRSGMHVKNALLRRGDLVLFGDIERYSKKGVIA